jgi:hypothetical protein
MVTTLAALRRFLRDTRGFVISTEKILLLALVITGLVVAVEGLRTAVRSYFVDEVDAIAACSNQVVFDPANGPIEVRMTTDFDVLFPALQEQVTTPVPSQATKE